MTMNGYAFKTRKWLLMVLPYLLVRGGFPLFHVFLALIRVCAIVFSGIFSFTFHFLVDGWDFGGMSGGGELFGGEAVFWEKVLEYFSESTAVLSGQYSSTAIGVLESSYWSIRVFLGEYSSTPTEVLGGKGWEWGRSEG